MDARAVGTLGKRSVTRLQPAPGTHHEGNGPCPAALQGRRLFVARESNHVLRVSEPLPGGTSQMPHQPQVRFSKDTN